MLRGGRNGTWSGGTAHIIPKGAQHPKEAKEFLKWLALAEAQLSFYDATGTAMFSTNGDAIKEVIRREPPKSLVKALLIQIPKANPSPPLWSKVIGELLGLQSSYIISLKQTPTEALGNLQRRMIPEYEKVFGK